MTSTGIHARTGAVLTDAAHIAQSIGDILGTPLGTRVMREGYGSLVPELLDHPQTPTLDLQLCVAAIMAIVRWEPRIKPTRMTLSPLDAQGRRELLLEATQTLTDKTSTMRIALGASA